MKSRKQPTEVKATCEHIDWDNARDCFEDAEYMCMCCASPTCLEHKGESCQFGGMGYVEL
jgi:hypothetical protein